MIMDKVERSASESAARRAARRAGYVATKSRWRKHSIDNHGGFMVLDDRNIAVAGTRYDLTAAEVIEFCNQ